MQRPQRQNENTWCDQPGSNNINRRGINLGASGVPRASHGGFRGNPQNNRGYQSHQARPPRHFLHPHNNNNNNNNNRSVNQNPGQHPSQGHHLPPNRAALSGEANMFRLNIKEGSRVFRHIFTVQYEFTSLDWKTQKFKNQTKILTAGKNPAIRQLCYCIFDKLSNNPTWIKPDVTAFYDGGSAVYSNKKLQEIVHVFSKIQIPPAFHALLHGDGSVKVILDERVQKIRLDDFLQYDSPAIILKEEMALKTALEAISTQSSKISGNYSPVGTGFLYRNQGESRETFYSLTVGAHIGFKMGREKATGSIQPLTILDFKKSLFFGTGNLMDLVKNFVDQRKNGPIPWKMCEKIMENVKVCPVYEPGRNLTFIKFTEKAVKEIKFSTESGDISMKDYYTSKKGLTIQNLDFPAATCGTAGDFPLEFLKILPNQKVDLDTVDPALRSFVDGQNKVSPHIRRQKIRDEFLRIFGDSKIMDAFGISFDKIPRQVAVELKTLKKPGILLGRGVIVHPDVRGQFKIGNNLYFKPAAVKNWAVLVSTARGIDSSICRQFKDKIVSSGKTHGMVLDPEPKFFQINTQNMDSAAWKQVFKNLQKNGCQFVLYVSNDTSDTGTHGMLKLMESVFGISTQHVVYSTALSVVKKSKYLTLENILLKTNAKNNGINFKVLMVDKVGKLDVNSGNVLLIGMDVCHPTGFGSSGKSCPSVVGLTHNSGEDPCLLFGDHFLQESRKESISSSDLQLHMCEILKKIQKNRKNLPNFKMPEFIVIFRDGLSDSQYSMVLNEELVGLKSGCFNFNPTYKPKFLLIIGTKRHHTRFFAVQGDDCLNINAGTCVDSEVTRSDGSEFYLKAQQSITGTTSKPVQFVVLLNEVEATGDEIKNLTHCCCYMNQDSTAATGLPAPIYLADHLAEKGMDCYQNVSRK